MLKVYRYLLSLAGSGANVLIVFAKNPEEADKVAEKYVKSLKRMGAHAGRPMAGYEYEIKEGGHIQT